MKKERGKELEREERRGWTDVFANLPRGDGGGVCCLDMCLVVYLARLEPNTLSQQKKTLDPFRT